MPIDSSDHYILSQILAFIAFCIGLYGINHKNDKHLKYFVTLAMILMSFHFFLLGAMIGVITTAVGAVRYLLSAYTKNTIIMCGFLVFYIGLCFINTEGMMGYAPILSSIIGTIALFKLEKIPMRSAFLLGNALNLSYQISYLSIVGIIADTLSLLITAKVILELRRQKAND